MSAQIYTEIQANFKIRKSAGDIVSLLFNGESNDANKKAPKCRFLSIFK